MLIEFAGGENTVISFLEATKVATNALIGMIMIDSALNVSAVEQLPIDPFVKTATRGRRRIATVAAHKMRAKGAIVFGLLEDDEADIAENSKTHRISSVRAIKLYQTMVEPLRKRGRREGNPEADHFLILTTIGKGNHGLVTSDCRSASAQWWPDFLRRCADDPIIGGLPIARNMIRTTVLQLRASHSGFGHALAQSLAQHKNAATTIGYIDTPWLRSQLAEQIATFQSLFEAAVSADLEHLPSFLKISPHELANRQHQACENGIDLFCEEKDTSPATRNFDPTCDPLNPCDQCPLRRFHPSPDNLEALSTVHQALVRAESHMMASNPSRWAAIWLPWRAVTEAYVQKIRRTQLKPLFVQIEASVQARIAAGSLSLPLVS